MSVSKKKKSTRKSGGGSSASSRKKSSPAAENRNTSSAAAGAEEETFVKKYYPVFENLVLFFLGMGTYWKALRQYLQTEFRYRTGMAFQGFAFFVVAIIFLTGSVLSLILGLFFTLQWLTGSNMGASFAIFLITLVLAALFFYLTFVRFQNVIEPRQEETPDDFDDF